MVRTIQCLKHTGFHPHGSACDQIVSQRHVWRRLVFTASLVENGRDTAKAPFESASIHLGPQIGLLLPSAIYLQCTPDARDGICANDEGEKSQLDNAPGGVRL